MSEIKDTDLFLLGIKPALLTWDQDDRFDELLKYPAITDFEPMRYDYGRKRYFKNWIFFQTEDQKQEVLKKVEELGITSINDVEAERLLGHILGYPPKAVDSYIDILCEKDHDRKRAMEQRRCYVRYFGFRFICFVEHILESIKWLWSKYPSNRSLILDYDDEETEINYGEIHEIQRWVDQVETKIYLKSNGLVHTEV
ncbi:hypothetical protein [Thermoflavimicrobium daqui]|jgi:hypothetical protein|uniref:Uncharacterized protein n=1 Tax=Thermoflavimicrobium daqui TaxID=2137476 RepID=A0A364K241_9BACL|nr:hypothetical protein [Thermoflavimicrobium daqui]RAL22003.1 hypothetical protein DL897_15590 [Thermoflavimicrobium daqui]